MGRKKPLWEMNEREVTRALRKGGGGPGIFQIILGIVVLLVVAKACGL